MTSSVVEFARRSVPRDTAGAPLSVDRLPSSRALAGEVVLRRANACSGRDGDHQAAWPARTASSCSGAAGFTRCASNPASMARRRSSPRPCQATRRRDEDLLRERCTNLQLTPPHPLEHPLSLVATRLCQVVGPEEITVSITPGPGRFSASPSSCSGLSSGMLGLLSCTSAHMPTDVEGRGSRDVARARSVRQCPRPAMGPLPACQLRLQVSGASSQLAGWYHLHLGAGNARLMVT
jgi:hypothetical protein